MDPHLVFNPRVMSNTPGTMYGWHDISFAECCAVKLVL